MERFYYRLFRLQKYKKFESNSQQQSSRACNCLVVSTAKVQKIWEQFTTLVSEYGNDERLFRLQKYKKFESNSQQSKACLLNLKSCFDCKSTKNLRAIHNWPSLKPIPLPVVSTAKVQKIWEQFTTRPIRSWLIARVVSTAKVQKIWEQFTTL